MIIMTSEDYDDDDDYGQCCGLSVLVLFFLLDIFRHISASTDDIVPSVLDLLSWGVQSLELSFFKVF